MSGLAIVIVSYNAKSHLLACLHALRAAPPAVSHEIVVVDNASQDGSGDAARGVAGVRVIALERNAGFAAANNAGIRATDGELILLLNSDTLVPAGAIDALVTRAHDPAVTEVILALNATVDGQTTAHYITDLLHDANVKVTRLAHGVPVGGELDYLDEGTLAAAIRQRTTF